MLKKYFCPEIQNDSYRLSKLDIYYAPPEGPFAVLNEYLDQLPLDEDPEVFGLHPNANMMYEEQLTKVFMNSITIIQPRVATGGAGKTPEEIGREMA
jgi:dynein heavy chain